MAYGKSKGSSIGGKGGGSLSLKTDMKGEGLRGSKIGKGKAGKQARAKV